MFNLISLGLNNSIRYPSNPDKLLEVFQSSPIQAVGTAIIAFTFIGLAEQSLVQKRAVFNPIPLRALNPEKKLTQEKENKNIIALARDPFSHIRKLTLAVEEEVKESAAATTIQTIFKSYSAEQKYSKTRKDVIKVQALIRGKMARKRYLEEKTARLGAKKIADPSPIASDSKELVNQTKSKPAKLPRLASTDRLLSAKCSAPKSEFGSYFRYLTNLFSVEAF